MLSTRPPDDLAATLDAVVDHLFGETGPVHVNDLLQVQCTAASDGEYEVHAKVIPYIDTLNP